jgi:hypothetical protein
MSRAGHHVGSMPWLGCITELPIEIGLMLNIRLAGNEFAVALQAANETVGKFQRVKEHLGLVWSRARNMLALGACGVSV